jgi:hypothetical protein
MINLVFFLEEPSAEAFLKVLIPRLLVRNKDISVYYLVFEGKQDLEKKLNKRLKGWRRPDSRFIVLRDQDSANCIDVKSRLMQLCPDDKKPITLIRIACRELESWYLADLEAVEKALTISGIVFYQKKRKYRNPDVIHKPSVELERLTNRKYQKISGSRAIGAYLKLDNSRSNSFKVFISGIKKILGK